jgi:uncharacterized protein (TIGR04255 family)
VNITNYNKPPITEAVIELRIKNDPELSRFKNAKKSISKNYFKTTTSKQQTYEIMPDKATSKILKILDIYSMLSEDADEQCIMSGESFSIVQIAPYKTWERLLGRFERDWKILSEITRNQELSRIGIRFINRIDIPIVGDQLELREYVNVVPQMPTFEDTFSSDYSMSVQLYLDDIKASLTLNTSVTKSSLPQHCSIMLDFDIYRTVTEKIQNEDLVDFLNKVRIKKNMFFESSITDKTRALFT